MSHTTHQPSRPADLRDTEVPPSLVAHETGLSPQRFRELIARGEDAYARRQDHGGRAADAA
jgi:hypothetical protein